MKGQLEQERFMRFPQGKAKAACLSFDDGVEADIKMIKLLNEYGLKGSFNLNSELFDLKEWHNRLSEADTLNAFKDAPHEIALHGARHLYLGKVSLPEAAVEIIQNRIWLEGAFGRIVTGLAYAYSSYNDSIINLLKELNVTYARTTKSTYNFALPDEWLKWHPTCHFLDERREELLKHFISACPQSEKKERESLLFFLWGHSYECDDKNCWKKTEGFFKELSGREDVWYATCGEIREYVKAYEGLVFSTDGNIVSNPSATDVWFERGGRTYKISGGATVVLK